MKSQDNGCDGWAGAGRAGGGACRPRRARHGRAWRGQGVGPGVGAARRTVARDGVAAGATGARRAAVGGSARWPRGAGRLHGPSTDMGTHAAAPTLAWHATHAMAEALKVRRLLRDQHVLMLAVGVRADMTTLGQTSGGTSVQGTTLPPTDKSMKLTIQHRQRVFKKKNGTVHESTPAQCATV